LVPRLRAGEPSTLAGSSAILVELPFIHWPPDTAQNLFKLSEAGYRPVLAHPERYLDAMQSPDLVTDAVALGAVPQITSGSLVGLYGADAQRLARYLVTACLEGDLPFIFSSDAHSAGRRLSSVTGGLDWVRIHLPAGAEIVEWATTAVPMQLVTNVPPQAFRTWLAQARPESTVPGPGAFRTAPAEGQGESKQGRGLSRLFRRGSH
jgi:tyrosine-protein phosphatase YwqE